MIAITGALGLPVTVLVFDAIDKVDQLAALIREPSARAPPRGFAKDHPQVEDLERKDHIAVCNLDTKELFGPDAPERLAAYFAGTKGYMRFLCKAIGVPF